MIKATDRNNTSVSIVGWEQGEHTVFSEGGT